MRYLLYFNESKKENLLEIRDIFQDYIDEYNIEELSTKNESGIFYTIDSISKDRFLVKIYLVEDYESYYNEENHRERREKMEDLCNKLHIDFTKRLRSAGYNAGSIEYSNYIKRMEEEGTQLNTIHQPYVIKISKK